jgi:CRISPR type I-E-associated protein CasB/Cse2
MTASFNSMQTTQDSEPAPGPGTIAARLAAEFRNHRLDNGERALLRRFDPEKPGHAASALVIRMLIQSGASDSELAHEPLGRWTLLSHLLALLAGTRADARPHAPDASLGLALYAAKVSESRLLTLLESERENFDCLLSRTFRRLAAAGLLSLDASAVWRLLSRSREPSERARAVLAHDYFVAQAKDKKSQS